MKLPPLPQARVIYTVMPDDYRYGHVYGYTAADMRAYALDAIEKRSSSPATGRAEADALRAALQPFADTDLTNPLVRDTFGFDVLRARAALQNHSRKDPAS